MLENLRVLELASVLAGPGVGQFFAELGAEVIKVENLPGGGDVTRTWKLPGEQTDDRSAYFCCTNWGKKSLALDLNKEEGKRIVWELAKSSNIVIASYKPGDAEKLGVDYETLRRVNAGLIYGQITGYGDGDNRVGYDAVIQAESGFMSMNGEPGGLSLKMPVALMDILAGHQLKEGLLVALLNKEKNGTGRLVSVSIIQSAIASLANQGSNWLNAGHKPQKRGSMHPNIAPYGEVFIAADGQEILLAIGSDRQFQDLCAVLGISTLGTLKEFSSNTMRVAHRDQLSALLVESFSQLQSKDIIGRLHEKKVPAGLVQSVDMALASEYAKEIILESHPIRGIRTFVANVDQQLTPPPKLGEHTHRILADRLNYDLATIESLRKDKVIK